MTTRLDRVQRTCIAAILAATPGATALWAPSSYPHAALGADVVTAKIVTGPAVSNRSKYYSAEPDVLIWRTSGAATAARVGLALTGARWYEDVLGGDTDTTVRDRLLAQLTAPTGEPAILPGVAITADGTDGIKLDATGTAGLLWGARAVGPAAVTVSPTSTIHSEVMTGTARCTVEFQAFSRGGQGVEAQELLGALGGSLRSDSMIAIRDAYGVTFGGPLSEPIDLTALAGADWESRASARLTVRVRSYHVIPIAPIETATVSGVQVIL